jgi:toxin ParE1/3/4
MEIVWRRAALDDLESIRGFIEQDNPDAAARVYEAIRSAVDPLAAHPNIGRAGRVDGTRELVLSSLPYIVVYRIVEEQVRILAVMHTSRQWPRRFGG